MITRTRRLLGAPLIGALIASVLVAPQAQAAPSEVDTWNELSAALAAGGHVTVVGSITGAGVTASQTVPTTLDLNGYNVTLTGGPALQIEGNANVTLRDTDGGGSLTAIGTDRTAAAIGTVATSNASPVTAGTLVVDGAHVSAQMDIATTLTNPQDGATVGGGDKVDGLTLTVRAGSLSASTVDTTRGAAIGGGKEGNSGPISITGGTVTATVGVDNEAYNTTSSTALGGGRYGEADITIDGGTVVAAAHSNGAAIGGGSNAAGGTITINGGDVTATTTEGGAAIGGGHYYSGGLITINGGNVTAISEGRGAGIGGGSAGDGGTLTVTGGSVNAQSDSFSSAIGGGSNGAGGTVTILGGEVTATNESFGAAIGGGTGGKGADVTIEGGAIHATATGSGSAIGGGYQGAGGNVTISGGTVDASARTDASTFGAGSFGPSAPPRPVAELGTLRVFGSALPAAPQAVAGKQASPLTVRTPASPIRFALENGPLADANELQRTSFAFGHLVNFNSKGGHPSPGDQFVVEGGKATTPTAPERSGYLFTGWFDGGTKYNFNSPVRADLNLTAGWDCLACSVAFDSNGGNNVATQSVERGGKVTQPSAPTRKGYKFAGWLLNGSPYNFTTPVTSAITLTAKWEVAAKPVNLVDVSGNKNSKYYTQFYPQIQWLANQGITKGWSVGGGKYEFRPKDEITREAMAAFMYRYAGSPAVKLPAKSPFKDVTPSTTNFYKEIIWLNQQGISTGWAVSGGKKEFRPKDEITRDAMAAFMYRFADKPAFKAPGTSPFADVPKSSQFYKEITWLANAGISTGWTQPKGKPQYRPYDEISREAMAAFLYRLDRL